MSARDPETGQFVGSDGSDVDYSDFEFQHFEVAQRSDPGGGQSIDDYASASFDPLASIGGLGNNEVAELVAFELEVALIADDTGPGNQDVATVGKMAGVMGANLSTDSEGDLLRPDTNGNMDVNGLDSLGDTDGSDTSLNGEERVEGRRFQLFSAQCGVPFDDVNNSLGGNYQSESGHYDRNYRTLTGRGPVLDYSDEMVIVNRTQVGDTVIGVDAEIRGSLVWDVAEVSDAGRAFSVPM